MQRRKGERGRVHSVCKRETLRIFLLILCVFSLSLSIDFTAKSFDQVAPTVQSEREQCMFPSPYLPYLPSTLPCIYLSFSFEWPRPDKQQQNKQRTSTALQQQVYQWWTTVSTGQKEEKHLTISSWMTSCVTIIPPPSVSPPFSSYIFLQWAWHVTKLHWMDFKQTAAVQRPLVCLPICLPVYLPVCLPQAACQRNQIQPSICSQNCSSCKHVFSCDFEL